MFYCSADIFGLYSLYISRCHSGSQIRIFRKIFKISAAQRISVEIHSRSKPDIHLLIFTFFPYCISKHLPQFPVERAGYEHFRRPGNTADPGRAVFIENGLDPFFLNCRRNISRISCRVVVCCNRFSFTIENRRRVTAVPHSRKGSARPIAHTERSEFFDGELRQILLRFFFSLSALPSCKNILFRYRNYRHPGHASIRFLLTSVFQMAPCVVFLCQERKLISVAF